MSQHFFDPRTAVRDLLKELAKRGCPRYPSPSWRCALELICARDIMRLTKAENDKLWPTPHLVEALYESSDDDPNTLAFKGFAIRMREDPAREVDEMHEARSSASDVIYRLKHNAERTAYNREYRRQHREAVLANQRDYRLRNGERLNARRRAKRAQAAAEANALTQTAPPHHQITDGFPQDNQKSSQPDPAP